MAEELKEIDSILNSVKQGIGGIGLTETNHFDPDIIMSINTVFAILNQMGIGPEEPFSISDSSATWNDFTDSRVELNSIKTYMVMKVRLLFDPPTNATLLNAMKEHCAEFEWRNYVLEGNY